MMSKRSKYARAVESIFSQRGLVLYSKEIIQTDSIWEGALPCASPKCLEQVSFGPSLFQHHRSLAIGMRQLDV